ncbi:MarR family winged helix-turn-helix transcriptional regulator [Mogibacterium sp.]
MKEYQSKFLLQMHSFHKIKFWSLVPELNPSEHMLVFALCKCESGKCGEYDDDFDIKLSAMKGVKVSDLAKAVRMTMPGVSRVLAGLEEKGIIERRTDKSDRRNTLVFLTEDGYKKILGYKKRIDKYFETVFERFGEDRVAEVIELIGELAGIAQEELNKELNCSEGIQNGRASSEDKINDLNQQGDEK